MVYRESEKAQPLFNKLIKEKKDKKEKKENKEKMGN
jgi:hypothetical protein